MNLREGIGERCAFASFHPAVNLIFYAFVIGIAMFSTHPLFVAISFVCASIYSLLLEGSKTVKRNACFLIVIVVMMAVINTFFTHDGETVLMYINGNRITAEALCYGISAAFIITSVIVWFSTFNTVMTGEKLIYIFGKAAPVLGLTLSMIFRFIPVLKARFAEISMGQKCMGRGTEKNVIKRARLMLKEISILISWSLETSIETADSMEARGYGLRGRTAFHLFRFEKRDLLALMTICLLGTIAGIWCLIGKTSIYYYPVIVVNAPDLGTSIAAIAYTLLLLLPAVIDVKEEMLWKRLNSQT